MSDPTPSRDSNESSVVASGDPGLVRLMGTTPLRDVVRGRLTGRLDILRACDQAGLPAPLRDLVLRTVRATRLWRIEKADVASELIAHFRDGLESGRSAEQLIASFGDPTLAARLIRSTKRRSRPTPWKLWLLAWKSAAAFLLLCVLAYAFLLARFHWGSPVLRTNVIKDLNAPVLEIPEEDRAWTRYRDAIRASVKLPENLQSVQAQWPLVPKDSSFRAAALTYLDQNRPALEHLHAAAAMQRLGYVLADHVRPEDPWYDPASFVQPNWPTPEWKDNPPAISILLPSLGEFRRFAHLLAFDSLVAREQGDAARVTRNINTTIAMAEHTRDLPFLISDLVAIALIARACDEVNATLHATPDLLTDDQLIALAHTLSAFPRDGAPLIRYETEAIGFEDALQRVYTDDGRGNGHVSAEGARFLQALASTSNRSPLEPVVDPLATALVADRASTRREYHELLNATISAARTPMWTWTEDPSAPILAREGDFMWRQRFPLIGDLMIAFGRTALAEHRLRQTRDATLTIIALTLAKRKTGAYPETLEALSPDLLPSTPIDIFDGKPLRYALVDGSPVLYSIGVDRKDDGGRRPKAPYAGAASTWQSPKDVHAALALSMSRDTIDGDWVLFPPLPPLPPPPPDDEH